MREALSGNGSRGQRVRGVSMIEIYTYVNMP